MKTLIFGCGGVGGIYVYLLEKGGAEVTAVCRSNYDAVVANGLAIESKVFGNVTARPAVVRNVSDAAGPFDFVLVCSKAFPGTSKLIAPAVSSSTAIVLCQNGIGIEAEYAEAFPENTIISGVVQLPTTQIRPGVIYMGAAELLQVGTYPASAPSAAKARAVELAKLFTAGGGTCTIHDDVQQQRWEKLAANASMSPITALTRCDQVNFLQSSAAAEATIRTVMGEVHKLATASGYPISNARIDGHITRILAQMKTGGKEPSMLTDVRDNRPMEVDAIIGNTIQIARKLSVETPALDILYALAKGLSFSIAPDKPWIPLA
jgi:2-dehydropantoate 2-reductase